MSNAPKEFRGIAYRQQYLKQSKAPCSHSAWLRKMKGIISGRLQNLPINTKKYVSGAPGPIFMTKCGGFAKGSIHK